MSFFSIDCSTETSSLFVKIKNKTFSKVLQSDKSNNDILMKQILDFFNENNIQFQDISKIYVNQGPGNFSGLRASLAVAKGIGLAKNLSLFGYSTFIWSCARFFNKQDIICSFAEVRKKFFIQKFDKKLNIIEKAKEITIDGIIQGYDNKFKVIPQNMAKHFDKKIFKLKNINIVNLDHNELEFLQLRGLLDKNLIKPLYLN